MRHAIDVIERPVHLAIAVLRTVRGWSQKELARALGGSSDTASDIECARTVLPLDDYLRILAILGYPPAMLDRALAFLRDALLPAPGGAGAPEDGEAALTHRIALLAAEAGQARADFCRELLSRFLAALRLEEIPRPGAGLAGSKGDPTLRLALAVLRIARGWGQKQLGAATGLHPRTISALERGRTDLTYGECARLAAALGYSPAVLDRALSFVRLARLSLAVPRDPRVPEELLARRIEERAARAGEAEEAATREEMDGLVREVRVLKALAEAPDLLARLLAHPPAARRALVEEGEVFRSFALCLLLCEQSEEAAADDADEAVELAELALEIARGVTGEDEGFRTRLEGKAQAFLGNSWRVRGNLPRADEAFAECHRLWHAGSDPDGLLEEVRVLDLEASLRREQRRFAEAHALLDRGLELRPAGPAAGRLLLKKAKTFEEEKDYESAVATLERAAPIVEAAGDPRLLLVLRSNLLENLLQLRRFAEAGPLLLGLRGVRTLSAKLGRRLDLVRLRWVEGRVAAGTGDLREAVAALEEVRRELQARGIPFDTALVSLELAAVYAELGRLPEVEELARQIAPIFRAQRIGREALATLLLFLQAVEQRALTAALAWRLAA